MNESNNMTVQGNEGIISNPALSSNDCASAGTVPESNHTIEDEWINRRLQCKLDQRVLPTHLGTPTFVVQQWFETDFKAVS